MCSCRDRRFRGPNRNRVRSITKKQEAGYLSRDQPDTGGAALPRGRVKTLLRTLAVRSPVGIAGGMLVLFSRARAYARERASFIDPARANPEVRAGDVPTQARTRPISARWIATEMSCR